MSAQRSEARSGRWLAIAASLVVIATIVAAIAVMGSPAAQREAKLDAKRVHDLVQIVRAITGYVELHDALPPDLAALAGQPGRRLSIVDPVDGSPYTYEITGARTFRLCAVFTTDSAKVLGGDDYWALEDWNHGAGRQCFDRKPTKDVD